MDRLLIENLTVDALIGVHSHEKRTPQRLRLDLELELDLSAAAASDDLADALDYVAVCDHLRAHVQAGHRQLIEALAESCASTLLQHFPVSAVSLTLRKPGALPGSAVVGVSLRRDKDR